MEEKNSGFLIQSAAPIAVSGSQQVLTSLTLEFPEPVESQLFGYVYSTSVGNTPVSGALVCVYDESGNHVASAYSDDKGHYTIRALNTGKYRMICAKNEFSPTTLIPVTIEANHAKMQDLILQPLVLMKSAVYGTIATDEQTPVQGARIDIITLAGDVVASTVSAAKGDYVIYGLETDTYIVIAAADTLSSASACVTITADRPTMVNFTLSACMQSPSSSCVCGFIRSADGTTAPFAWVGLYALTDGEQTLLDTTLTTADGYYAFTDVASGNYIIKAKA